MALNNNSKILATPISCSPNETPQKTIIIEIINLKKLKNPIFELFLLNIVNPINNFFGRYI